MDLKERVKSFFHRDEVLPVEDGHRRLVVPDGIIEGYKTVFAVELVQEDKKAKSPDGTKVYKTCGARFYYFKDNEVSTQKTFLKDMDQKEWQIFKQRLQTAKDSGYIEFDDQKVEIPLSLSEGIHGVYAVPVSVFDEKNVEFVPDGVNIYRLDERHQIIPIRSMSGDVWRNYKKVIDKTIEQEEALRANIMNFETDFQK